MHIFDIIVLCTAAVFAGVGMRRGLILEVFRLAAVVGGFVAAVMLYRRTAAFSQFIDMPEGVRVGLAFILVAAGVTVGLLAVGWVFKRLVHLTVLGWLDRLGGGGIGLVKCAVVVWAVVLALGAFPVPGLQAWLTRSAIYSGYRRIPFKLLLPHTHHMTKPLEQFGDKVTNGLEARLRELRARVDSVKSLQP